MNDDTPVVEGTTNQDATEQSAGLKVKLLDLAGKLSDLVHGEYEPVEDLELSHEVALSVKSYVDRLHCLRTLLSPVERVIRTRGQIAELQTSLVEEVAEIEDLSGSVSDLLEPALLNELQSELSAVKKDRKLFVSEDRDDDADDGESEEPEGVERRKTRRAKSLPLLELPIAERLQRIFGSRFVGTERLEEIFGQPLVDEDRSAADEGLEPLWASLFDRPEFRPHVEANHLAALRKAFVDYVEDIYDRAVLEAALKTPFFDNCNSLTRTKYVSGKRKSGKQVFVYSKGDSLRVTGKRGTPHWRPGRPLWPGVLVSVVFESS